MPVLSKPYVITDAGRQSEDIDRMFDDVYTEMAELEREHLALAARPSGGGASSSLGRDQGDGEEFVWWPLKEANVAYINVGNRFIVGQTIEPPDATYFLTGSSIQAVAANVGPQISFQGRTNDTGPVTSTHCTIAGRKTNGTQGNSKAFLSFSTDNGTVLTEEMRLLDTGALSLLAGKLTFPAAQSASTDANTLDDYEEGAWTPNDASGASLAFSTAVGAYVKVGRSVLISAQITYPATADGTAALIGGLPFTNSGGNIGLPLGYEGGGPAELLLYAVGSAATIQPVIAVTAASPTNAQMTLITIVIGGVFNASA